MDLDDARSIGERARMIRRHRGLSLEVVAGFAGITAQYLSMMERGLRGFNRRGLIEDLARAGLLGGGSDRPALRAVGPEDGRRCDVT